ncbi:MAG: hypothetical protein ACE5JJ_12520, partial [Nitrospinota bacterium]
MPRASARFIRAAWSWFLVGLALGVLLALGRLRWGGAFLLAAGAPHVHVLLFGFLVQWVMGVAYWVYPRRGGRRPPPRTEKWPLRVWWFLNGGTLLRAIGESLWGLPTAGLAQAAFAVGILLQVGAGFYFVAK